MIKWISRWRDSRAAAVAPENRLSPDAVTVLALHGFYSFGTAMAGVFLNLYLWRLTNDLFLNGMYNIIVFFVTPVFFVICGYWAKTRDRLLVYRIGVVLTALFYLAVIAAGSNVAEFAYVFAVLNGIANGFYWLGYLTLQFDISTNQNRMRFLGFNLIMVNGAGLAGPALAGFIIANGEGLQGYTIVFSLAFVMFLAASIGSLKLRSHPSHHKAYYLKYTLLMARKSRIWSRVLLVWFIFGLLNGAMLFIPNILLLQVFGKEDSVGYIGMLFTGITIITSYLFSRRANPANIKLYCAVTAIFYALSVSLLFLQLSVWTVIGFLALYGVCFPIQFNALSAYNFRVMSSMPLKGGFRVEAIAVREITLSAGRILSIFGIILLSDNLSSAAIPGILLAAALAQLFIIGLVRKL
ncbi:MFS transporter [Paenibacillus gansuensis]|uniref:MFS transporter n=1 Tax=Paenibacillus gansuensis TaxID=306542 RepID=A0ABW5PHZ9_9BACL